MKNSITGALASIDIVLYFLGFISEILNLHTKWIMLLAILCTFVLIIALLLAVATKEAI